MEEDYHPLDYKRYGPSNNRPSETNRPKGPITYWNPLNQYKPEQHISNRSINISSSLLSYMSVINMAIWKFVILFLLVLFFFVYICRSPRYHRTPIPPNPLVFTSLWFRTDVPKEVRHLEPHIYITMMEGSKIIPPEVKCHDSKSGYCTVLLRSWAKNRINMTPRKNKNTTIKRK